MLGFPAMREPTKTPSRINSQKSIIISTFIDKYTTVTPKNPKSLRKPWETRYCGSNPEAPGESRRCCLLSPNHRTWVLGSIPPLAWSGC
ncbi:hypothetical protein TNCV_5133761 [Trichonephila clavipes]|nr:hypothetical protein TNCV_5133761 [Trichonephila clavipes]